MKNIFLNSYGYLLICPDEMIKYVQQKMRDDNAYINWNNFNANDVFCTEENTFKCVIADHPMRRIMFVTEDEYNNSFNFKHNGE